VNLTVKNFLERKIDMKRLLIVTFVLACLAMTQGKLMAGLVGFEQPAAVSLTDGDIEPSEGDGNE
jgi:hypothetical protein